MDRTGIGGGIETRTGPRKDVWQDYGTLRGASPSEGQDKSQDPGDWRYPETGNCGIWSVYRIPWSLVSAYKEGGK